MKTQEYVIDRELDKMGLTCKQIDSVDPTVEEDEMSEIKYQYICDALREANYGTNYPEWRQYFVSEVLFDIGQIEILTFFEELFENEINYDIANVLDYKQIEILNDPSSGLNNEQWDERDHTMTVLSGKVKFKIGNLKGSIQQKFTFQQLDLYKAELADLSGLKNKDEIVAWIENYLKELEARDGDWKFEFSEIYEGTGTIIENASTEYIIKFD